MEESKYSNASARVLVQYIRVYMLFILLFIFYEFLTDFSDVQMNLLWHKTFFEGPIWSKSKIIIFYFLQSAQIKTQISLKKKN